MTFLSEPMATETKFLTGAHTVTGAEMEQFGTFSCSGTWALTLPTPAERNAYRPFAVVNYGSGTITLTSTANFLQAANTLALSSTYSCLVYAAKTTQTTYKWVVVGPVASAAVAAIASTNPVVISSTTTPTVGALGTVSDAGHTHGQGVHTHADATHGGVLSTVALGTSSVLGTAYTPVMVNALTTTRVGRYSRIMNTVHFYVDMFVADGLGVVLASVTLPPVVAANVAARINVNAWGKVDTTWTNMGGYIDCLSGTQTLINFHAPITCTNGVAMAINISGTYEGVAL